MTEILTKSIQALQKKFPRETANVMVTLLPCPKQEGNRNCGLSAVAFASEVLQRFESKA